MTPASGKYEPLLIDGTLTAASGGQTFPNINPATEEVIGVTADATSADIDRAIAERVGGPCEGRGLAGAHRDDLGEPGGLLLPRRAVRRRKHGGKGYDDR